MFRMLIESHEAHSDIENSLERRWAELCVYCMLIISYGGRKYPLLRMLGAGAGSISRRGK